ncbi:hypothetical protein NLJ89_g7051 [Agrocybe chaxingu]|uniref:Uncharacterized protein n=1 Tax=Agrocybe chaxingu TaxID=84603 RepID=A0A9W8K590_9AGAR|nr:hypothetical protein NLJ89_g7051 [Agrocybe chaxingu]
MKKYGPLGVVNHERTPPLPVGHPSQEHRHPLREIHPQPRHNSGSPTSGIAPVEDDQPQRRHGLPEASNSALEHREDTPDVLEDGGDPQHELGMWWEDEWLDEHDAQAGEVIHRWEDDPGLEGGDRLEDIGLPPVHDGLGEPNAELPVARRPHAPAPADTTWRVVSVVNVRAPGSDVDDEDRPELLPMPFLSFLGLLELFKAQSDV